MAKSNKKNMKWKNRLAEINRLRAKHGKDRSLVRSFPDLSVENRTAPTSDRLDIPPVLKKEVLTAILGPEFVISHLHKSGYQVFHRRDLPNLEKKV
jgi:hypothetical protein